ncbi:MAG: CsbD family protein, partial [Sphingomonadaceae bacterium]|nr:CsbD family protein [Sphingomonadaceae bacterium]
MGELTDKIKGGVNEAIGKVKRESNNPDTRAEGDAQEAKGDLQKKVGA